MTHIAIDKAPQEPTAHSKADPAPGGPLEHPVRGRINASFFRWIDGYLHWKQGATKERLFADLPSTVVEIGPGVGANFRYMRPGTRVVAYEPNVYMHDRLRHVARTRGIEVEAHAVGAEAMELPDESVDAVICTMVLCTVEDAAAAVRQVHRVLRPGGRFICIEHVAAPPDTFIGRLQRWIWRPWAWFFEGCHTHRDTHATLRAAGFGNLSVEPYVMPTVFLPIRPQIAVVAVK
jgi:ubiquinone/menaquinone biosynthesis C-methylase UbiE